MRAAGITRTGGEVRDLDLADPRSLERDEVLIAVKAAGVGNWDEYVRMGEWDVGLVPPMALGVEAAGVVTEVGGAVTSLAAGDEVVTHPLPLRQQGTWAEALIALSSLVARKPAGVSWTSGAAFPVPALTAEQVVSEALDVQSSEWLLVNGAGGTTGGLAVQLAVARGARVIATAGPAGAKRLGGYGAVAVLDYHDPTWPRRVRSLTGQAGGVSAAMNAARNAARSVLPAIASGGRLATITGDPPPRERDITVSDAHVRPDGGQLSRLVELLAAGRLSLPLGAGYGLEEAATALAAAAGGRAGGAVALTVS